MPLAINKNGELKYAEDIYIVDNNNVVHKAEQVYIGVDNGSSVELKPLLYRNLPARQWLVSYAAQYPISSHNSISMPSTTIVTSPGYNPVTGEPLPTTVNVPSSLGPLYTTASYSASNTGKYYSFDGWYLGDNKVSGQITVSDNITLTAKWTYVGTRYYWTTLISNKTYNITRAGNAWDTSNGGRPPSYSRNVTTTVSFAAGDYLRYRATYNGTIYLLLADATNPTGTPSSVTKNINQRNNVDITNGYTGNSADEYLTFGHTVGISGSSLSLNVHVGKSATINYEYESLGDMKGKCATYKIQSFQGLRDRAG